MFFLFFNDYFPPQLRGLEHVGLVHRADAPAALARSLERDGCDTPHLGLAVAHGIEALAAAVAGGADAARLSEVDVAGELAHDQDVEPRDELGFQRRGGGELRVHLRRAQVGKQPELLAQPQQRLLRALGSWQRVVARAAYRAEENRVGFLGERKGGRGQRIFGGIVAGAADRGLAHLQFQAEALQDLARLGNDFRPDAVTGQERNFHQKYQGNWALRRASKTRILSAWRSGRPVSSRPVSRQCLRNASISKGVVCEPSVVETDWFCRFTTSLNPGKEAHS